MGRHRDWRKVAKRERRRRVRTQRAREDERMGLTEEEYEAWMEEQEHLDLIEIESIELQNRVENEKWLHAERVAAEQWQKLLVYREKMRQERLEKEAKLKLEWEAEQKRKKEDEERLKKIEEEKRERREMWNRKLEEFLSGEAAEPPPELQGALESRAGAAACPFFAKTGCCRFGDACSRNHKHPALSKVVLCINMYSHFGLGGGSERTEYDTDVALEYDTADTSHHYAEFYYDALPEFRKYGAVTHFVVCNNHERHLRGNTYVQYAEFGGAVRALRALQGRWYAGRQLRVEFVSVPDWRGALCGLQFSGRCPKGRSCNFLHVFRNPGPELRNPLDTPRASSQSSQKTPRNWRWSESPEMEIPRSRSRVDDSRSRDRSLRSPDRTSRSRSPDRRTRSERSHRTSFHLQNRTPRSERSRRSRSKSRERKPLPRSRVRSRDQKPGSRSRNRKSRSKSKDRSSLRESKKDHKVKKGDTNSCDNSVRDNEQNRGRDRRRIVDGTSPPREEDS